MKYRSHSYKELDNSECVPIFLCESLQMSQVYK